jgi:predicted RNA-binding protein with PIN domain
VLLDTLQGVALGLRRELALGAILARPADALADTANSGFPEAPLAATAARGQRDDDPALLDALLNTPGVHLVVDGYNVTKTGYGTLPLETQRARLLAGLSALAAQTGAEITCVFDGAERPTGLALPAPRGVRLLFSRPDEIADDLIRRLVRAEPAGRPVVVISSDREVADGVRSAGAQPLPATALLRRLDRG